MVQQDKIDPLILAFRDYWVGSENLIITPFHLNTRKMTKKMQTYIAVLKDKIKVCEYGPLEDSLLRDRLVARCDMMLCSKLLQTADLTLASCIDMCELGELSVVDQLEPRCNDFMAQEV